MKQLFKAGLACLLLTSLNGYSAELSEGARTIQLRVERSRMAESKLYDELFDQKKKVVEKVNFFKQWRNNLTGIYELGKVQKLEVMAERYEAERQSRAEIEKEILAMFKIMDRLEKMQMDREVDEKILALKLKINEISDIDEIRPTNIANTENVMFIDILEDTTYKEIASRPEVYDDEESWQYLFEANKDKFPDPLQMIPQGSLIIAPKLNIAADIGLESTE